MSNLGPAKIETLEVQPQTIEREEVEVPERVAPEHEVEAIPA